MPGKTLRQAEAASGSGRASMRPQRNAGENQVFFIEGLRKNPLQ